MGPDADLRQQREIAARILARAADAQSSSESVITNSPTLRQMKDAQRLAELVIGDRPVVDRGRSRQPLGAGVGSMTVEDFAQEVLSILSCIIWGLLLMLGVGGLLWVVMIFIAALFRKVALE